MTALKKLSGVAHDIAHHAQSGMSWLHPHLGQACRAAGVASAGLDLLTDRPYPDGLPRHRPLELALAGLQDRFGQIRESVGIPAPAVRAARLEFSFLPHDDYSCSVRATVTAQDGRTFEQQVVPDAAQHALHLTRHGAA